MIAIKKFAKIIATILLFISCSKINKFSKERKSKESPVSEKRTKKEIPQSNVEKLMDDLYNLQFSGVMDFAFNGSNGTKDGDISKGDDKNQLNNFKEAVGLARFEQGFQYGKIKKNPSYLKYSTFKEYIEAFEKNFEGIKKNVEACKEHKDLTGNKYYKNMDQQIHTLCRLFYGKLKNIKAIKDVICGDDIISPNIKSLHSNTTEFKKELDKL